ncbi:hypothetical protein D1BOALGB6SA_1221 [Olavius sp. associated proteobacterium Delta 1]|nr:hypothetical protein D1BOALGB6SA_1221 [Olavius sp. associated proteobacterium Delta 1]
MSTINLSLIITNSLKRKNFSQRRKARKGKALIKSWRFCAFA